MTEIRSAVRMAAAATVLGLALVGCGEDDKADPGTDKSPSATKSPEADPTPEKTAEATPDSGKGPWGDGGAPAARGKTIGTPGSPCGDLPLTFTSARDWTSEAVQHDPDFEQGGLFPVCEVDAKPGGNIGYLRVFTGETDASPREALAAFIKDEKPVSVKYRTADLGGTEATEVSFASRSAVDDEKKPELAFAVETGDGIAVVSLRGLDAQEHTEMIPAYLLARETAKVKAG